MTERPNENWIANSKMVARRFIPRGSPLWYPYFFLRRLILRKAVTNVQWYRIYGNVFLKPYNAIYFDIPKVACSSLKKVWAEALHLSSIEGNTAEKIHLISFPYVKTYQIRTRYGGCFKFCFVRNPWDRVVSCYMDKIQDAQGGIYENHENHFLQYLRKYGANGDLSFEEFVEIICGIPDSQAESHFKSQHQFISDHRGDLLVDFVGRFENLQRDFEFIANKLGINASLPHLRRTSRRDFREYYNVETRAKVAARYQRDIELFDYSFDSDSLIPARIKK